MDEIQIDSEQKNQLIRLRDEFRRNASSLSFPDVRSYMEDLIHGDLRGKLFKTQNDLINPEPFSRAVWYCLCNNNAERNALIERLYAYFVNKVGVSDDKALDLISVVLFLGGVDFQISNVKKPEPVMSTPVPSSHVSNTPAKKRRWAVPAAIAAAALVLLLVLIPRLCGKDGGWDIGNDEPVFKSIDLCREYDGWIDSGTKEYYIMHINDSDKNTVQIRLIKKSKQTKEGTTYYTATIKGEELRIDSGPRLSIKKSKNKIKLSCEESRGHGAWNFESK